MMRDEWMSWGWGPMWFGPLFWLAIIGLVVWLIARAARNSGQGSSGRTALDILDERFARGEIDEKELEERRKALKR